MSHHVRQRGNNRCDIFRTADDYELFLHALVDGCTRFNVSIDGYVLMTNHVHLVLTPASPEGISATMQAVGRRYVLYFNQEYGRTGGLYEGRYRAVVVDSEDYWYTCLRYIELNPVRAGMVTAPGEYKWSSYRAHASGAVDSFLTLHSAYLALGACPDERQRAWQAACGVPLADSELQELRESFLQRATLSRPVQGSDPCDES